MHFGLLYDSAKSNSFGIQRNCYLASWDWAKWDWTRHEWGLAVWTHGVIVHSLSSECLLCFRFQVCLKLFSQYNFTWGHQSPLLLMNTCHCRKTGRNSSLVFTALWLCNTVTVWHCDRVTLWLYHAVTVWRCDRVTLWPYHAVTVWRCDRVTPWPCDAVTVSRRDHVTLWPCDTVTVWHCDCVTLWPCDTVTVWHCDCVLYNTDDAVQCIADVSLQLCRVVKVRQRILSLLNGAQSLHDEAVWSRRQFTTWCRASLFTPLDNGLSSHNTCVSFVCVTCTM